jgi:hypothetical protein
VVSLPFTASTSSGGATAFGITNTGSGANTIAISGATTQNNSVAVLGTTSGGNNSAGVRGVGGSGSSLAGDFTGNVAISGSISKGSGTFKIDHPLDPENKYLYHSFVESPDMMNIYNGIVELDAQGEAWVRLPEYFEALNQDFRYQLTCIGGFAPVYIADKIQKGLFRIAGGKPGLEISWQVTGIRHDAFANVHRVKVEVDKPDDEKGTYLHPEEAGKPKTKGLMWMRYPDLMWMLENAKEEAGRK